ncbi:DUF2867 domain-containing protein [Pararhodobacter sp.]|uniref:DUF2867 domain-containing protein n=1 Tax=Pararhodobacter sp. TaxID=2127056 RepID=UPI002FDD3548
MTRPDLAAPPAELLFHHARSIALPQPMSALEAWNRLMQQPLPGMALAFRLRDAISARFGVARIGGFSGQPARQPQIGERLDFFLIERIEPEMLTLSVRDRHLDVLTCVTTHAQRLTITSSVKVHNLFGRAYMIPVAPAHRLIVMLMMHRLKRALAGP